MSVRDICLASSSGIRECPTLFPWYACNNDDLEIYAKLIMHAPMWTLKHQVCGHVTLRLRIHFSHLNQPSVSKRCSFINLCIHLSPFWAFGKIFTAFTLQVYHTHFLSKTGYDQWIFQRKAGNYLFSKACWLFSWKIYFLFLFVFFLFFFFFSYVLTKVIELVIIVHV